MFVVDDATAEAIRRAYDEGGELSGIVEFRRHFPLITDNAKAGECVRIIAGWKPLPDQPAQRAGPNEPRRASGRTLRPALARAPASVGRSRYYSPASSLLRRFC